MRIVLIYSPDPIYISPFILRLLETYTDQIVGVLETKGSLVRRRSRLEQLEYLMALLIILGIKQYLSTILQVLRNKIQPTHAIQSYCEQQNIPYKVVKTVNAKSSVEWLTELEPDVMLNQSHHILKKSVLAVARIGILNRHGAFLPDYRGRLAPFWQLYRGESHGGMTYHLLDEGIDTGPIVYQEYIPIADHETVHSLALKVFDLAVKRFGTVIDILNQPDYKSHLIENPADGGSYFSSPRLKDALRYRFMPKGQRFHADS